jgi:hypothetical protein
MIYKTAIHSGFGRNWVMVMMQLSVRFHFYLIFKTQTYRTEMSSQNLWDYFFETPDF